MSALSLAAVAGADDPMPTPSPSPSPSPSASPSPTPTPSPTGTPGYGFAPVMVLNTNAGEDTGNDYRPQALALPADGEMWVATWTTTDTLSTVEVEPAYDLGNDEDIVFAFSLDGGDTWEDPVPIPDAEEDLGDDALSRIATSGGTLFASGTLVMVWESNDNPTTDALSPDYDILIMRNDLAGDGIWTAPARLHSTMASDAVNDHEPQIIAVDENHWIVTWHGSEATTVTYGTDMEVLFSETTDAEDTWTTPAALNINALYDAGDDKYSQIAVHNGFEIALWQSSDTLTSPAMAADDDIHVSFRSPATDHACTWPEPGESTPRPGVQALGTTSPRSCLI